MQYSIFGSILTVGAMIGAIVSGKIADYAGRRVVSFSAFFFLNVSQRVAAFNFKLNVVALLLNLVVLHFFFMLSRPWDSRSYSASWDGLQ